MKKINTIIVLVLATISAFSQPEWTVNSADYEFSMNMTGKIKIDGNFIEQADSWLGAFVNGECRGIIQASEINSNDFYYFLTIYANTSSEEVITFKLYDASGEVHSFEQEIVFTADKVYGNPDNPFLWISPSDYSDTGFIFYSLDNQIGKSVINSNNNTITVTVNSSAELGNLTAYYSTAQGTRVTIASVEQQSGISSNDFSSPVIYTLENTEENTENWTIILMQKTAVEDFTKNPIRIYPNPAKANLRFENSENNIKEIKIFDLKGRTVLQSNFSNQNCTLNISHLRKGFYFVKIKTNTKSYFKKIVKE